MDEVLYDAALAYPDLTLGFHARNDALCKTAAFGRQLDAGAVKGVARPSVFCLPGECVFGKDTHTPIKSSVFLEGEGGNLDAHRIAFVHLAYVLRLYFGFHFKPATKRNERDERFCFADRRRAEDSCAGIPAPC